MRKVQIYIFLFLIFAGTPIMYVGFMLLRLLTFWFDKKGKANHWYYKYWAMYYLFLMPKYKGLTVSGMENIDPKKTYVIVSNHQSQIDIIIGFQIQKIFFRWVSKAEMFKVPFIGWSMHTNKYISIQRADRMALRKMANDCAASLKEGISVFLFPEGTRSEDGQVKKFMSGAFSIALDNQVDILPVVIRNTGKLLPKDTLIMNEEVTVEMEVLPPLVYEQFKGLTTRELTEKVRDLIIEKV